MSKEGDDEQKKEKRDFMRIFNRHIHTRMTRQSASGRHHSNT